MITPLTANQLREIGISAKQLRALRAVVGDPNDDPQVFLFWLEARRGWHGPQQTLGWLHRRGLVIYDDTGCSITDAGLKVLAEVDEAERLLYRTP